MSNDYSPMWQELGLDLEKHSGLLSVLSDAYKNIYLSQNNRPKAMSYFDFVIQEVHGLRIEELKKAKEQGRKVVGTFCVYVPEEVVLALNGVMIGLCAGADVGSEEAERFIPRNTCALIKAFLGFKLARLCPYVESTDIIVGETTCDGKKKAYEVFNDITKKVYVMEIPNMKQEEGRKLWFQEVKKFAQKMEELSGQPLTLESLKNAVDIVNKKRKALQRLASLRQNDPLPISGLDALLVNQISFYDDPIRFTQKVNELCDELETRVNENIGVFKKGTPRILVTGCPFAIPNWKIHHITETSGASIVGEESCVGSRNYRTLVDEDFSTIEEGLKRVADRYLTIDCACFTPNSERIENISNLIDQQKAEGVIHYALQFCTPYTFEAFKVEQAIKKVPILKIETDYSMEDVGQLKTRIEAFVESLK